MIDWNKLGFEVCGEASDGEDALAMMASTLPHLVLTDVRMPVIDGLELIEQASYLHPEVKFIILSGYADFEYAKRAMRYGVANYMMKPLIEAELVAAVKAVANTIKEREATASTKALPWIAYDWKRFQGYCREKSGRNGLSKRTPC